MYDHSLHQGKKNVYVAVLYKLSVHKEILKHYIKDCFKINDKQKKIVVSKKGEYVKLRNYERKIKSPFII